MSRFGWMLLLLFVGALVAVASMIRIVDVPSGAATRSSSGTQMVSTATASVAGMDAAPPGRLVVPVVGVPRSAIQDSWGDMRGGGTRGHQAVDIMAPGGTPVIAAAPGTIEKLYYSQGGGGTSLYVRSPDRRWSFYYAHLQGYAPGIREGMAAKAGDPLGFVGDSGNAGAGNYHLHFAMARMGPTDRWWQGTPIDPYPLLAGKGAGS
jgi:peptidoglycan LD-endopeptidase LytH